MIPVASGTTIEAIALQQRRQNAQSIALALTLLGLAVIGPAWQLRAPSTVLGAVAATCVATAISYLLARRGLVVASVFVAVGAMLCEQVFIASTNQELQPVPYLAVIPILIASATLPSRLIWVVFLLTMGALGTEGLVNSLDVVDQGVLLSGSALVVFSFVISLLHARSAEHALDLAIARDTERAHAAAAAIEYEERFRLLADHTDDLLSLVDGDGKCVYLNPTHERLLGKSLDEMMGVPPKELLPSETYEAVAQGFRSLSATGEAHTEAVLYGADGIQHLYDVRMTRVASKSGPVVAISSRDITEKKQMQQRVMASERMESLGRLAGSVAHDFNNLLMVIGGSAEMARLGVKDRPDVAADIDSVIDATRTASKLTRQLLTFSRKQVISATELDLADALGKIRELLERLVGKKVSLVFDFEPNCPKVMMAAAHLEQLAMNLSINARDAMPEGGKLTFALRSRSLDTNAAPQPAGPYTELSVSDEGVGIPADVLPRVFEPLFTTKGDGGTGLGLATCHSIATQWHGSIVAESAVGQGTTFRVLLPAAGHASAAAETARPSPVPPVIRRVLVVDDEPAPRETAARLLRLSGFEVVVASNLTEARQHIADPQLALDALLTDVVLSGELGTDLLEECRKRRPTARIVVMSGYSPNPSATEKLMAVSAKFLPKPFTRQELLNALQPGSVPDRSGLDIAAAGKPTKIQ